MNPAEMPLTIDTLSKLLRTCHWLGKSKKWQERLLFRLATAHLDTLTQQALAEGQEPKGKWASKVKK